MSGSTTPQTPQNLVISASLTFAEAKPHLLPLLPDAEHTHPADLKKLEFLWEDLTARAQTLPQLAHAAQFLLADVSESYTAAHTHTLLQAHHLLHHVYDALSAVTEWTPDILTAVLTNLAHHSGQSPEHLDTSLRTALCAQTEGPALARILTALGQNESLRRLKTALHHIHQNGGGH